MSEYYLAHHGILGQKWGVRRYQNRDGSYTEEGRKRYSAVYSERQSKRDASVYSSDASKRIAERVYNGESVQGARSREAGRLKTYKRKAKTGGFVMGRLAALGSVIAAAHKLTPVDPFVAAFAAPTISIVVQKAVREMTENGIMLAGGYSPEKKYD